MCSNVSQEACRRSADGAVWNGKRELDFKGSRRRYLTARGGMALAVRRPITGISSRHLGVALLVDTHDTSVNRWELRFAAACTAAMRRRRSADLWNRISFAAPFVSCCIFTEETPPTRWSEGRSCTTANQCPRELCWASTRTRRGLTSASMSRRSAPGRICIRRTTTRHAACTLCI